MVKRKKALPLWDSKKDLKINIHIHIMDNQAKLHKLTVLSQLLLELHIQTLATQTRVIKSSHEEDLRTMLLNRYPLRLNETTMTALIKAVEELCPTSRELLKLKKKNKKNIICT